MSADLDCIALRKRAENCRLLATGMRDKTIRDRLIEIAVDYDAMAREAEGKPVDLAQRVANLPQGKSH